MQAFRATRLFTRITQCVALWFALTLTAAAASPLIHPRAFEVICSASGVFKLVVQGEAVGDSGAALAHAEHRSMDCALCLPVSAPPTAANLKLAPGIEGSFFELPASESPPERRLALNPPPRGPPAHQFA